MDCLYCKHEFEPGRRGGRRQKFCPGGKCRRAYGNERIKKAIEALNRHEAAAKKPQKRRLSLVEMMEQEAIEAGYPGMFAHPSYVRRRGREMMEATRENLGRVAMELGLLETENPKPETRNLKPEYNVI